MDSKTNPLPETVPPIQLPPPVQQDPFPAIAITKENMQEYFPIKHRKMTEDEVLSLLAKFNFRGGEVVDPDMNEDDEKTNLEIADAYSRNRVRLLHTDDKLLILRLDA